MKKNFLKKKSIIKMNFSSSASITTNNPSKSDLMNTNYNTICQEIISADAKFNLYRINNNAQLRTLYMRRRTQLLRENAMKTGEKKNVVDIRRNYLSIRNQILEKKFGNLDQM